MLLYNFSIPANVLTVVNYIKRTIEFEALKPRALAERFGLDDHIEKLTKNIGMNMINAEIESDSQMDIYG